jgi:hypothetical protein
MPPGRRVAAWVTAGMLFAPGSRAVAGDPRAYDGTRATPATDGVELAPAAPSDPAARDDVGAPASSPAPVPPPRVDGGGKQKRVAVAVGLAPEAPGNAAERQWLDHLERSARVSPSPATTVRRLRPGVGDAQTICRDRKDDVVVLIGYVPRRDDAVLLPYDCLLGVSLGIRALAAADEDGLVGALWAEHEELVRNGMTERRRLARLSPRARAGIVAGVAIVVIGVAVGLLVANALRDEKVVVKVAP